MNVASPVPLLLSLILTTGAAGAAALSCTAKSGPAVPAFVELYTSEGCDSCPPADRWFSTLKADAQRGKVVPLAFHVDYWDYIGWKDRFADPRYGTRHRATAANGGAKVVYTPHVFLDSREFLAWRKTPAERIVATGPGRASSVELQATASAAGNGIQLAVSGAATNVRRPLEAYVALYENGLASEVSAGENRGVRLSHDFVVRQWLGPFAFEKGKLELSRALSLPPDAVIANAGVAVVAFDDRGAYVQALALPLRECGG